MANFSAALQYLKEGQKWTRKGWNGSGMWIEAQLPESGSKNTRPYLFIVCPAGSTKQFGETAGSVDGKNASMERVPWLASQTDLFAEDWESIA